MVEQKISVKTIELYFKTLYKNRKQSIYWAIIYSLTNTTYNLFIALCPTVFILYLKQNVTFEKLVFLLVLFCSISFFNICAKERVSMEQQVQDQIFINEITDRMNRIPYYYLGLKEIKEEREACIFAIQNYGAIYDLYSNIIEILKTITTSITVIIILLNYKVYFSIIIIILLSLLELLINDNLNTKKRALNNKTIKLNFLYGYFQELVMERQYQVGNKYYNYADIILNQLYKLNTETTEHFNQIRCCEANMQSLISIISHIQKMAIYFTPLIFLAKGQILIEDFALLVGYGMSFSQCLSIGMKSMQNIQQSLHYLIPFHNLMCIGLEKDAAGEELANFNTIELKNVYFKYPNTDEYILDGLNLKIKKGQKIAIVGENGTGKTTLAYLLMKLYKATKGGIYIDGVNINDLSPNYTDKIATVFQDAKVFAITVKENINATSNNYMNAITNVGFDKILLRKKISADSYCNAEIFPGGVEFSGGEKALLALSRAVCRNGELVILDEPSAALDPIMKNDIFIKFDYLFKEKTVILITHNLNFARKCENIYKLENGQIVKIK